MIALTGIGCPVPGHLPMVPAGGTDDFRVLHRGMLQERENDGSGREPEGVCTHWPRERRNFRSGERRFGQAPSWYARGGSARSHRLSVVSQDSPADESTSLLTAHSPSSRFSKRRSRRMGIGAPLLSSGRLPGCQRVEDGNAHYSAAPYHRGFVEPETSTAAALVAFLLCVPNDACRLVGVRSRPDGQMRRFRLRSARVSPPRTSA